MINTLIASGYFILLLFILVEFALTITGSVILSKNNNAIHEPENVWIYVLVQNILMWLCICGFGSETQRVEKNSNGHKTVSTSSSTNIIGLGNLAISIWGFIIYFQATNDTKDFYLNVYPSLWHYLEILCIYHLILFCIMTFLSLFICCALLNN